MLLYQGTPFVKGNVFKDPRGSKVIFDKSTKKGKIFILENGTKAALTEGQISKLKLLNEAEIKRNQIEVPRVIGINIKFDGCDENLLITKKSLKNINTYTERNNFNHIIGYVCFDMKGVKLKDFTLEFLKEYQKSGMIEVMFDDLTDDCYKVVWISGIQKIQDDIYLFLFEER